MNGNYKDKDTAKEIDYDSLHHPNYSPRREGAVLTLDEDCSPSLAANELGSLLDLVGARSNRTMHGAMKHHSHALIRIVQCPQDH
jgi:hypothetical protein